LDSELTKVPNLSKRLDQNPLAGKFPAEKVITKTPNAPIHLKVDSQKDGSNTFDGYAQYENAGEGTWVYVVDTGFTQFGDEFDNVPSIVNLPGNPAHDDDTADADGHGTSVAALAVGKTFGVAPKASLVNVKIAGNPTKLVWSDASAAILRAINHIVEHGRQGKAVINLSSGTSALKTCTWPTNDG
jgi:subtilisin family serine protease